MDNRRKRGEASPNYKHGRYANEKERAKSRKRVKAGYFARNIAKARAAGKYGLT